MLGAREGETDTIGLPCSAWVGEGGRVMDLVLPLPHAAFGGEKYYPGGDKRLPKGRHPLTGLMLELGLLFLSPPARRQRRGLYKKRTRPFQSPPGLGRKEVFGVSTLFLSAIFLVLAGRSVVPILLYFQWDLILERIQRRESLGFIFFSFSSFIFASRSCS